MIEWLGFVLAVAGSIASVVGTLYNNLKHDHRKAMEIWGYYANPLLLVWAIGFCFNLWDSGLSGGAFVLLYSVNTISNWYGLR